MARNGRCLGGVNELERRQPPPSRYGGGVFEYESLMLVNFKINDLSGGRPFMQGILPRCRRDLVP